MVFPVHSASNFQASILKYALAISNVVCRSAIQRGPQEDENLFSFSQSCSPMFLKETSSAKQWFSELILHT